MRIQIDPAVVTAMLNRFNNALQNRHSEEYREVRVS
jgi:hypothetical protein